MWEGNYIRTLYVEKPLHKDLLRLLYKDSIYVKPFYIESLKESLCEVAIILNFPIWEKPFHKEFLCGKVII